MAINKTSCYLKGIFGIKTTTKLAMYIFLITLITLFVHGDDMVKHSFLCFLFFRKRISAGDWDTGCIGTQLKTSEVKLSETQINIPPVMYLRCAHQTDLLWQGADKCGQTHVI